MFSELEKQEIIDYLAESFPKWQPTDIELKSMLKRFNGYKLRNIKSVLDDAAYETNFNTPPKKTIKNLLSRYKKDTFQEYREYQVSYVQCLHHGTSIQRGCYSKVNVKPGADIKQAQTRALEMHERQLGGTWVIVIDATEEQMIKRKYNIQNNRPICDGV